MQPKIYRDVVPKKNCLELLELLKKYNSHKVMSVADATKQGDIIHILLPDMIQNQYQK